MSQQLARTVAAQRGADLLPVMATIEAETNFRNVLGEYAAATARFGIGFGQVHLRWHFETLRQVAQELDVDLPSQINPMHDDAANEPFRRLILNNDLLSMSLAVAVIDRIWRRTGNFESFTRAYVGAGISERDMERRRVIWTRWVNTLAQETTPRPVQAAPRPVPATPQQQAEQIGLAVITLIGLIAASIILPKNGN